MTASLAEELVVREDDRKGVPQRPATASVSAKRMQDLGPTELDEGLGGIRREELPTWLPELCLEERAAVAVASTDGTCSRGRFDCSD